MKPDEFEKCQLWRTVYEYLGHERHIDKHMNGRGTNTRSYNSADVVSLRRHNITLSYYNRKFCLSSEPNPVHTDCISLSAVVLFPKLQ